MGSCWQTEDLKVKKRGRGAERGTSSNLCERAREPDQAPSSPARDHVSV